MTLRAPLPFSKNGPSIQSRVSPGSARFSCPEPGSNDVLISADALQTYLDVHGRKGGRFEALAQHIHPALTSSNARTLAKTRESGWSSLGGSTTSSVSPFCKSLTEVELRGTPDRS